MHTICTEKILPCVKLSLTSVRQSMNKRNRKYCFELFGYDYLLDWCHDDQPVWMATRGGGRILSVPYPQELNDIPAVVARKVEGRAFAEMIIDGFDEQLEQSAKQPLVLGIALHPYIVGQPHRLRPLRAALEHIARHRDEVWLCEAGEIAAHWREHAG